MKRSELGCSGWGLFLLALTVPAWGQANDELAAAGATERGITTPTLYVIGYAHLDTQWRWTYPQVIGAMIPNTMSGNFAHFPQYPDYVFNFSGANRYRMMKEYYPADYETVKQFVATGQWFPCGSSMEECDVMATGAESIIRQVLYGNHFFRHELGRASAEFMLPDCFGFPASLPTLLAHCGLKGFSTQKLSWGSAVGIPFNVGVWTGLDGTPLLAALNAGSYVAEINSDLSQDTGWLDRINQNGQASGVYADYSYYGVGDQGGAPGATSVQWLEASVAGTGPVEVKSATAEQMFLDIPPASMSSLPNYQGDLLLTEHSAGSITSQAYMKRWNRKNELLADAAERAAVFAEWLGGPAYPRQRLNDAWTLVMGGQFHDILPGTSHPQGYVYSWGDELLALNQFGSVLDSSVGALAGGLNTQAVGVPLVVYNPLSIARQDLVEATVTLPYTPTAVRVVGPDGLEVPAQIRSAAGTQVQILFLATVPSVGFAVYDVQPAASALASTLAVTTTTLENARYLVTLDGNGDVASIYDKTAGRELLAGPARLAFSRDFPGYWPAWNMDWSDAQQPPQAYLTSPARVRVVEHGPARIAVEVTRDGQNSHFVQTIRLAAGDAGERVEFANTIDWRGAICNLKATFPLTAANPYATYNWEVGTLQRGVNDSSKYEVPTHGWIDQADAGGTFGVTLLTDCKYGSDKPDDATLRLTLLRTPGANTDYQDQATQDWGRHEILYGLAGHVGTWQQAQTDWQALRLQQPPLAFQTTAHSGNLGRTLSLLSVNNPRARVMAVKKAEDSGEIIVRLVEASGQTASNVRVTLPAPLAAAREVNGQELPVGAAAIVNGSLATSLGGYRLRTFALTLDPIAAQLPATTSQAVALPCNRAVTSGDGQPSAGGIDSNGRCLPAEMLSADIAYRGTHFQLGPVAGGQANAVQCAGQTITLPTGNYNRLYLLATAGNGGQQVTFGLNGQPVSVQVQDWGGFIGQWDRREWYGDVAATAFYWDYPLAGLTPAYLRPDPVVWFCSHRHSADGGNEPYEYCYLFAYALDLPAGTDTLTLPTNNRVFVLAATLANDPTAGTRPVQPLGDDLPRYDTPQTVMTPIAATGWNRDIVVEAAAQPDPNHPTNKYFQNYAQAFDVRNGYALYEHGLAGGDGNPALPTGGAFTSMADGTTQVQFQPYDGLNVLQLSPSTAPTGTLTFATAARRAYARLAIFAASTNAGQDSVGNLTITFTDGTTTSGLSYMAQDWFFHCGHNAICDLGRAYLPGDSFHNPDYDPRIYQTTLDLTALGLDTKPIHSLTFEVASGGNSNRTTAIFAVSGATPPAVGDLNCDGAVDAADAALLASCLTGPGLLLPPPGCDPVLFARADLDGDGDVDVTDYARLQRAATGS
jgi:alpha-mannosidase